MSRSSIDERLRKAEMHSTLAQRELSQRGDEIIMLFIWCFCLTIAFAALLVLR